MTLDELKALQAQPTDFSRFDASLYEDATRPDNARYQHDDKLFVTFYKRPIMRMKESNEAGRPIYREEVCIKIYIPGDKTNQIDRIASEMDIERFRKQYEKFLKNEEQVVGTPLEFSGIVDAATVEELRYFNVRTVEQLAGMNDGALQKFAGGQQLKQRAQAWLDRAQSATQIREDLQSELAKRDQQIEQLKRMLASQGKKGKEGSE